MKKIITIIAVICMVFCTSTLVFAQDISIIVDGVEQTSDVPP